ncbi:MAG: ECF-type sigma factor [Bryobacterales bacterium]|jgi:RNA polymerase sigma factor (TIGR02999 family)|nr:ECF-type sigma factor [Bryobacterales bacterium]
MLQSPDSTEIYRELQKIAAIHLRRSSAEASIQPTQLVHEAWLRLHDRGWKSRTHFLALASRTMRMVLIDAIRARMSEKRAGNRRRVTWSANLELAGPNLPIESVIALDTALNALAEKDERKARVVELRFFGGLTFPEIAETLDIAEITAKRDWEFARTWLFAQLSHESSDAIADS